MTLPTRFPGKRLSRSASVISVISDCFLFSVSPFETPICDVSGIFRRFRLDETKAENHISSGQRQREDQLARNGSCSRLRITDGEIHRQCVFHSVMRALGSMRAITGTLFFFLTRGSPLVLAAKEERKTRLCRNRDISRTRRRNRRNPRRRVLNESRGRTISVLPRRMNEREIPFSILTSHTGCSPL